MLWLFGCKCSRLPAWVIADDYSSLFRSMQEVGVKRDDFTILKKCKKCGQHWQVDDDLKNLCLAVKISDPINWPSLNDFESRKTAMIENHWGISDAKCMWSGCNNHAMSDMVFCVECAYRRRGIRV